MALLIYSEFNVWNFYGLIITFGFPKTYASCGNLWACESKFSYYYNLRFYGTSKGGDNDSLVTSIDLGESNVVLQVLCLNID